MISFLGIRAHVSPPEQSQRVEDARLQSLKSETVR
jgi:hypothetical protein